MPGTLRFYGWQRSGIYQLVPGPALHDGRLTGSVTLTVTNEQPPNESVARHGAVRPDGTGRRPGPEAHRRRPHGAAAGHARRRAREVRPRRSRRARPAVAVHAAARQREGVAALDRARGGHAGRGAAAAGRRVVLAGSVARGPRSDEGRPRRPCPGRPRPSRPARVPAALRAAARPAHRVRRRRRPRLHRARPAGVGIVDGERDVAGAAQLAVLAPARRATSPAWPVDS